MLSRPMPLSYCDCFFDDWSSAKIYPLSLHDALPISISARSGSRSRASTRSSRSSTRRSSSPARAVRHAERSEEHTSELQSRQYLVCRLLLEKKKKKERRQDSRTVQYVHALVKSRSTA